MEVEIRTLADKSIFEKLISRGAKRVSENIQLDRYWANSSMFDKLGYTFLLRIRTDSRGRNILSYKGAKLKTEGVWEEYEINFDSVDEAQRMLIEMGFENFVNLKKKRVSFKLGNFDLEVDEFENFGLILEIETKCGPNESEEAKERMRNVLMSLGVNRENIIEKGSLAIILEKMNSPYKEFFKH
jgi:predicted adenylyl cyclase CyaB